MIKLVIDGNLVLGWLFEDRASDYADRVLDAVVSQGGVIPAFVVTHLTDIMVDAERRNKVSQAKAGEMIDLLFSLPIEIEPLKDELAVIQVQGLARQHQLSAYEATYLYQSGRENRVLASEDQALITACRHAGVSVFE